MNRQWAQTARDELEAGRAVQIAPRGHSMAGRVSDGDLVTLVPCSTEELAPGDIVLARVRGRRFFHLVLHLIHAREAEMFLIGSNNGRMDGWVDADAIFGSVSSVEAGATDEPVE